MSKLSRALGVFIIGVCNVAEPRLANLFMQGWRAR